jgi:hypothetical protein
MLLFMLCTVHMLLPACIQHQSIKAATMTSPLSLLLLLQPFEFTAGESVSVTSKVAGDTAGGLFAGGSGPKPPPALSTAVIGMKQGGKVRGQCSHMSHQLQQTGASCCAEDAVVHAYMFHQL